MTDGYRPAMEPTLSDATARTLSDKAHPAQRDGQSSSQVKPDCGRCGAPYATHAFGVKCP